MSRDPYEQQRRNVATFGAMVGLLFSALALLGLAAMVIPSILLIVAVLAGVMLIGVVQYFTWGWMLEKYRVRDDDDKAGS